MALIACEDTRVTKVLLDRYEIQAPLLSLQKFNEAERSDRLLKQLLSGDDIALISDAGTPNIADPGAYLIRYLRSEGVPIVPIPGPSSVTCLASVSGELMNQFHFAGFFPKKQAAQVSLLGTVSRLGCPVIFFETAKRLRASLVVLEQFDQVQTVVLAKELTKRFETLIRGSVAEVSEQLDSVTVKGEWCMMVTFSEPVPENVNETVAMLAQKGYSRDQVIDIGTRYHQLSKNAIYEAWLKAGMG